VLDVHDELANMLQLSSVVPVRLYAPKSNPSTVIETPSQAGRLRDVLDATGASNEHSEMPVPARPDAVTNCHVASGVEMLAEMHDTLVELDHVEVSQTPPGKNAELVISEEPKFNPLIVTEPCPDSGVFSAMYEKTGASNVRNAEDVPAAAATVTKALRAGPSPGERRHSTLVPETQAELPHEVRPIAAVAVGSKVKKSSPNMVTLSQPEPGAFELK